MFKDAVLSPCRKFRYSLSRTWDASLPQGAFVMLNPSTADASEDDQTIRKCIGFSQRLGLGGFEVVNLFAFRATDPAALREAGFPIGPDNDRHITNALARLTGPLICAWGAHARGLERPRHVQQLMIESGHQRAYALVLLKDGTPGHPVLLPYTDQLVDFPLRGDR
jgi:hypothetical protein